MKTKFYYALSLIILFAFNNKSIAQANQQLSNLTSPTAVNQSLLPSTAHSKNLGNSNNQWQYLYLYGRIYLNGELSMHAHGTRNFFAGAFAGNVSVTGTDNTGIGYEALTRISNGQWNTAVGVSSLVFNTTGSQNSAFGFNALLYNAGGQDNTSTGASSLSSNTNGSSNTATGVDCLSSNSSGNYNTANGIYALGANTTGSYNTAAGSYALWGSFGSGNSALGHYAGYSVYTGSYNTFIGYYANPIDNATFNNSTAIGYNSLVTAGNMVRIGNSSITSIGGYVNWSNISDGRVKKNIKQNVPGLAFINKLTPITYNLDLDAADKILNHTTMKDKDGKIMQPSQFDIYSRKAKQQVVYTGFIAQDVEKAAKELNYDFSGVDAAKNDKDLYGLRYAEFVVPLVKAVQELSTKNDSLQNQNNIEQNQINNLQKQIDDLKAMIVSNQSTSNGQQSTALSSASLSQNIPNPFSNTTTISYSIPQTFSSAKIIITDKNGNVLKRVNLNSNKGSVNINASALINGAYQYSLYVDGKMIASKQMQLIK